MTRFEKVMFTIGYLIFIVVLVVLDSIIGGKINV